MIVKNIKLWIRLLRNRDQSMLDAIKKGEKVVWLTTDHGTRINYFNPGRSFWGGSSPIEKYGLFRYRTFSWPGGKSSSKKITGDGPEWVSQVMGP